MRSLKQQVVIHSHFGPKAGPTPGRYIKRYTTRDGAAEPLTPYAKSNQISAYIKDYMMREEAADTSISLAEDQDELTERDAQVTPRSARLFGNRGLVYDEDKFNTAIETTEKALHEDHTLVTPIISFEHEFLQRFHIVEPDMPKPRERGGYRDQLDQLKLRRAISAGMKELTNSMFFVKPEWTASIQVDTLHVHAHVTLIETAPHEQVPEARHVFKPLTNVKTRLDGSEYNIFVRDENNKVVKDDLGERGKVGDRAKTLFRRGLERELTRSKELDVLRNEVTSHRQLVRDSALTLALSNTKLSTLLMEVYEALPKHNPENEDERINDLPRNEEELVSNQRFWRARSHAQVMERPNELMRAYVDELVDTHGSVLQLREYQAVVKKYAALRFEDGPNYDASAQRKRVEQTANGRLKEELANRIYDRLKRVRVEHTQKDVSKRILHEANEAIEKGDVVAPRPFSSHAFSKQYVAGQVISQQLKLTMLPDDQLKDLISDGFVSMSEDEKAQRHSLDSNLTLEKRIRDYPKRYHKAIHERNRYQRLLSHFDELAQNANVDRRAYAMRDLYDVNREYYQGVSDKYKFLTDHGKQPKMTLNGHKYQLPIMETTASGDLKPRWSAWLRNNQFLIKEQGATLAADASQSGIDSTIPFTKTDHNRLDNLTEPLKTWLQVQPVSHAKNATLDVRVSENPQLRYEFEILAGAQQHVAREYEQVNQVSKKRFDEVKAYDILDTIYDFDADQSRHISHKSVDDYAAMSNRRYDALTNVLQFMTETGQASTDEKQNVAYDAYRGQLDSVDEDCQLAANLKQTPYLPLPVRRFDRRQQDYHDLDSGVSVSAKDALHISRELLPELRQVTQEHVDTLRKVAKAQPPVQTQAPSLREELSLLNQVLLRRQEDERRKDDEKHEQSDYAEATQTELELQDVDESLLMTNNQPTDLDRKLVVDSLTPAEGLSQTQNLQIRSAQRHQVAYQMVVNKGAVVEISPF